MGLFKDKSTFRKFTEKVTNVIVGNPNIDEEFYEELEESLVISDIGIETTDKIMDMLRKRINAKYLTKPEDIKRADLRSGRSNINSNSSHLKSFSFCLITSDLEHAKSSSFI